MKTYDLIVLGAGSGNTVLGPALARLRTAIIEPDRFGGTCLNRGCIPSKMLVVTADAARGVSEASRLGVHATLDRVDWPAIRGRVFGRIDPLHAAALEYRKSRGIDVYTESARFVGPRMIEVDGEILTAPAMVLAVGARPLIPPIPGLDTVPFHTSDTIMRIEELPATMIVIGGGFIAAELGHVFASFGVEVTIIARGPRLLMAEDEAISARFTELAEPRFRLLLDAAARAVRSDGAGVTVTVTRDGVAQDVSAEVLLVATGRVPNTDLIEAKAGELDLDEHGHIATDNAYRTSVPGVLSFGDAANHFQLKHMANAEARVVAHNLAHPDHPRELGHTLVPHAVFSDPQIASVGLTQAQAQERGIPHRVAIRDYADTAYGWALEDTTSFVKLVVDPGGRTLLGAHIIGPQAAILLQPLVQGMTLGQTVDQLARDVIYIHPALSEVLEQALLEVSN